MDMDIPDPEELEWLESHHSNFHDEDDDFDFELPLSPPSEPEPPESPEPEPRKRDPEPIIPTSSKPTLSLPPKPSIDKPQGNAKKRFRFDVGPELIDHGDGGFATVDKRSRVGDGVGGNGGKKDGTDNGCEDEEEDWLRYSPPLEVNVGSGTAMAGEKEVKERFLSRYATEIEGDCVPVTGLDGERVYAKICRVDNVERVKKLDVRGNFEGSF